MEDFPTLSKLPLGWYLPSVGQDPGRTGRRDREGGIHTGHGHRSGEPHDIHTKIHKKCKNIREIRIQDKYFTFLDFCHTLSKFGEALGQARNYTVRSTV